MEPTQQDLMDAACWFDTDRAGGAEMTAFKREARWRQHRWAVDELQVASFGTHPGRRTRSDVPPDDITNGTKLTDRDAAAGCNFLSPAITQVVTERIVAKQEHETLDAARLQRDLLSSMPMAFNLFGEASLPHNEASRRQLAELFGVEPQAASDIVFEWSPGRLSQDYTRDRTAFDVALRLGEPDGSRAVVGIETKYHEHPVKEATPGPSKPDARRRYDEQTELLVNIAEDAGVFREGWKDRVLGSDLRQIWRDHLLALSMRRHPDRWTAATRYVLLHPRRNVSFAAAAGAYAGLLADGGSSFRSLTVEEVIGAAFAHGGPTAHAFTRRYLWGASTP